MQTTNTVASLQPVLVKNTLGEVKPRIRAPGTVIRRDGKLTRFDETKITVAELSGQVTAPVFSKHTIQNIAQIGAGHARDGVWRSYKCTVDVLGQEPSRAWPAPTSGSAMKSSRLSFPGTFDRSILLMPLSGEFTTEGLREDELG